MSDYRSINEEIDRTPLSEKRTMTRPKRIAGESVVKYLDSDLVRSLGKHAPDSPGTRPAFITGSHVYGKPHDKSDVDIVIFMDRHTYYILAELFGVHGNEHCSATDDEAHPSMRFGSLNIIHVFDALLWDAWHDAKMQCIAEAAERPEGYITKDRAIQVHEEHRSKAIAEIKQRKERERELAAQRTTLPRKVKR